MKTFPQPYLGIAYALCPFDLFPDVFVGVGWIDDLLVLGLLWWFFYGPRRRQPAYEQETSGAGAGHLPDRRKKKRIRKSRRPAEKTRTRFWE